MEQYAPSGRESALSGESEDMEKLPHVFTDIQGALTEYPNLAFMGTNVISGSAMGIVIATGDDTIFGEMAKNISGKPPVPTSFEKGVNSVSWLLATVMLYTLLVAVFKKIYVKRHGALL